MTKTKSLASGDTTISPRVVRRPVAVTSFGLALLTSLLTTTAGAHAHVGATSPGALAPVVASLDRVPVGTWAEYQMKRGDGPGRKLRQALVNKTGSTYVLEGRTENPSGGRVVTQVSVTSDPAAQQVVQKIVNQVGDGDPMELPAKAGRWGARRMMAMHLAARFLKPDAKNLVGKETVTLAAGSFAADHYRQAGPRGGTVDYWLSSGVGPFGLVKMEMQRPTGAGKVTMELLAKGNGATAEISKPAKPFDPKAMPAGGHGWHGGGRGKARGNGDAAATQP